MFSTMTECWVLGDLSSPDAASPEDPQPGLPRSVAGVLPDPILQPLLLLRRQFLLLALFLSSLPFSPFITTFSR